MLRRILLSTTVMVMTTGAPAPVGEVLLEAGSGQAEDTAVGMELDAQAITMYQQGRYAEATLMTEDALRWALAKFGPDDMSVAKYQHNLARLSALQHKEAEAALLYQRALEIVERAQGPNHPRVASVLESYAVLDRGMGNIPHAQSMEARARAIRAADPSQQMLWKQLSAQVSALSQQGRYAEATEAAKRAVHVAAQIFEPDDPSLALSLSDLAEMYRVTNQPKQAEPLHQRALAIRKKAFGPRHPAVAESLNTLGRLYAGQRNDTKAQSLYEQALEIDEAAFGKDDFAVANDLNLLADLHIAKGDDAAAVPLCKRILAILEHPASGSDPRDVVATLERCAQSLKKIGKATEAQAMEANAKILREKMQTGHP